MNIHAIRQTDPNFANEIEAATQQGAALDWQLRCASLPASELGRVRRKINAVAER